MIRTKQFTQIADGILRLRISASHGETLAERYGILSLPGSFSDSGILADDASVTLPGGRVISYRTLSEDDAEYTALHDSLAAEFQDKYTDYQAILGAPEENSTPSPIPAETVPTEASAAVIFAVSDGERFYGGGEGANDRIELRGRAYQNWVRYQYNEIPIPFITAVGGEGGAWGVFLNAKSRTFFDVCGRKENELVCLFENDEADLFILAAEDMAGVIRKYTALTGAPMLLPKWAYGLTYIAPIFATQQDVLNHAEHFRKSHIPCDMISLEPGWMKKFYDYGTDKEWELTRFHMPSWFMRRDNDMSFIAALHRYGFHLSLWLCIRHDVTGEAERKLVNGLREDYGEAWYDHLRKFTDCGVDGYKLDPADLVCCFDRMNRPRCRNGLTPMEMHNLNQILLTKQMYEGYAEQENRRPMHHYSGGYSGIQHWSASTTGDNGGELGAMIWLETLALSGHMNTTIDMNIHHPESIHFGMLVPWAHLNAWHGAEQPWWAGDDMYAMFVSYARMRYRLLPYFYSAAIEGHEESMPIVRPMPLAFPDDTATAGASRQYMVGHDLLVSAYADRVHLPAGTWTDAWTGKVYEGPSDIDPYAPPANRGGGLFVRGGAILPGWRDRDYITQYSDGEMTLDIYPCGTSSFIFREDDGISLDYETHRSCHTKITCTETENEITVEIGAREGDYQGKPAARCWLVRIHPLHGKKHIRVTCAAGDRVTYTVPKDPVAVFNPDVSDLFKS